MLEDVLVKLLAAVILIGIIHVGRILVSKAKSINKNHSNQDTEK